MSLDTKLEDILHELKLGFADIADLINRQNFDDYCRVFPMEMATTNVSGDQVALLDHLTNQIMVSLLKRCRSVRFIASEEEVDLVDCQQPEASYLVAIDPLDGSSNIDVNITVGSIFAIFKYNDDNKIRNGRDIVMAGYCLYGGSTELVVATKGRVDRLRLNRNGRFEPIDELKIPNSGKLYAINESNRSRWHDNRVFSDLVTDFISQGYSQRWVASLVADAHRTLLKGGFFSYPCDTKNTTGRIRLLYEVYPMAFIFEQAGGYAPARFGVDLLDLPFPHENVHQRAPIILCGPAEYASYINYCTLNQMLQSETASKRQRSDGLPDTYMC